MLCWLFVSRRDIPCFLKKINGFLHSGAGLLFLIYPFHNESIAWLSGRLSSMACLFALISLIITSEGKGKTTNIMSALFFLLGLLCYESIIFLPAIILIIQWLKGRSVKNLFIQSGFWLLVIFFYLFIRLSLSGEITGELWEQVIRQSFSTKMFKCRESIWTVISSWIRTPAVIDNPHNGHLSLHNINNRLFTKEQKSKQGL